MPWKISNPLPWKIPFNRKSEEESGKLRLMTTGFYRFYTNYPIESFVKTDNTTKLPIHKHGDNNGCFFKSTFFATPRNRIFTVPRKEFFELLSRTGLWSQNSYLDFFRSGFLRNFVYMKRILMLESRFCQPYLTIDHFQFWSKSLRFQLPYDSHTLIQHKFPFQYDMLSPKYDVAI